MAKCTNYYSPKYQKLKAAGHYLENNASEVAKAASAVGDPSEVMNVSKDNLVSETESLSAISEENAASAEETNASMEELSQTFAVIEGAAEELQQLAVQLDEELQYFKTD